jgi:glucosylceramidase
MKKLIYSGLVLIAIGCNERTESKTSVTSLFNTDNKKVIVYSTADSSALRLSLTETLEFKDKGQPFENEVIIFVDPSKTFQTYMGTGAH